MRRFALLTALIPLTACATAPAPGDTAPVCPPTDNWQVWIDAMPGRDAQLGLIVDGEVDVPPGMVARLRPGPLDRAMPPGQRFVLELRPGKGPAGKQRVRGEAKPALAQYREVIIGCGGETLARIEGSTIETAD